MSLRRVLSALVIFGLLSSSTGPVLGQEADAPAPPPAPEAPAVQPAAEPAAPRHSAGFPGKLTISGFESLTYRLNSVRGSAAVLQTFNYSNYERQYGLEHSAGLNITGQLSRFTLNANINQSRYSPLNQNHYNLAYKGEGLEVNVGHLNAALQGNEFVPFSRSLVGMKVDAMLGKLGLSTILSEERAQVATDSFTGTNSSGPYPLRYSPVLDGTAQVRVDGQLKKLSVDYTLDLNTGMLWFQPTILIPATSTIEVSYEYAGYGQNPGLLAGVRADLPLGKLGRVGTTYISQISRAGATSPDANRRTDLFIGDNTAMVVPLRFRPVARILLVTLDGVPQIEGVDFVVQNLEQGILAFKKVVPAPPGIAADAAPNLIVEYEISDTAPRSDLGNRGILGLDGLFNLGGNTNVGLQFAHSSGATGRGGNALSLRGTTSLGPVNLNLNYRDIGSTFTAIQSVGFQQKERALSGNLEYKATDHVRVTAQMSSAERPSTGYYYGGSSTTSYTSGSIPTTTAVETTLRALQSGVSVTVDYPKLPQLQIGHQRFRTTGSQLNSGSAVTNLQMRYGLASNLSFSASLDHNSNYDRSRLGSTAASLTQRYNVTYTPGSQLSLQADYSNSNLQSRTPSTTSTTTDASAQLVSSRNRAATTNLTATYQPFSIARVTASYRVSDSGSGYGGLGGYGSLTNSYYTSPYTSGGYMSTGNYAIGDQWTGNYYTMGGSSPISSVYGTGTGTIPTGTGTSSNDIFGTPRSREGETTDATTASTTSTRIRSESRSVGLILTPLERLNLNLNYTQDFQQGQYTGSDSASTNASLGFNYAPFDALAFNGQISRQRYRFLGVGGNSGSSIAFLGAQVGPWQKLTFNLNFQTMNSSTGVPALTGTGTTTTDATPAPTSYSTHMNTFTGRVEYPIAGSKLFSELQLSKMLGGGVSGLGSNPEDSSRLSAAMGIEFTLGRLLGVRGMDGMTWSLNLQRIQYTDRNNSQRNYRGNLLTSEMRARF